MTNQRRDGEIRCFLLCGLTRGWRSNNRSRPFVHRRRVGPTATVRSHRKGLRKRRVRGGGGGYTTCSEAAFNRRVLKRRPLLLLLSLCYRRRSRLHHLSHRGCCCCGRCERGCSHQLQGRLTVLTRSKFWLISERGTRGIDYTIVSSNTYWNLQHNEQD